MHDIGNVINRNGHSQSGSIMALEILRRSGMDPKEISIITAAIGNHDEGSGQQLMKLLLHLSWQISHMYIVIGLEIRM